MMYTLRDLQAAERHVAQAQQNLRTQHEMIERLARSAEAEDDAHLVLDQLKETLDELQRRRDLMREAIRTQAA